MSWAHLAGAVSGRNRRACSTTYPQESWPLRPRSPVLPSLDAEPVSEPRTRQPASVSQRESVAWRRTSFKFISARRANTQTQTNKSHTGANKQESAFGLMGWIKRKGRMFCAAITTPQRERQTERQKQRPIRRLQLSRSVNGAAVDYDEKCHFISLVPSQHWKSFFRPESLSASHQYTARGSHDSKEVELPWQQDNDKLACRSAAFCSRARPARCLLSAFRIWIWFLFLAATISQEPGTLLPF